jgi:hypothetical protein
MKSQYDVDEKGCTKEEDQDQGVSGPHPNDIQPFISPEWLRSLWSSVKELETSCFALQEAVECSIIDQQPRAPGEGGRRISLLEVSLPLPH